MIPWILVFVAILAGIEIWARPEIHAHLAKAYAILVDQWVAIALIVAAALLVDALVRRFYWHGYLKRRRGLDTPALIQDIVTILLVAIGLSIGLTYIAGLSVTGIVTASGATAIVLGIALQAVIQDLFSGLAINFEGSYAIGDWLTIFTDQVPDPIYGCVSHISWRSTYLTLADGSRLMVPNHMVTSNPVMNHSRPREAKRLSVELCIDNRIPTDRVVDVLLGETFKVVRAPGLARHPEPAVLVARMDSDAIYYEARFYHLPHEIEPDTARSQVRIALLQALQQSGLATPVTQVELTKAPDVKFEFGEKESRSLVLRAPLFEDILEPEHVDILISNCRPAELPAGAVLMAQGDQGSSMFIIMEGAATVTIRGDTGQSHEVNILAAGDVAGEMSLMTGAPRNASVTALTRVRVLEVTKSAIALVLQKSPELAERFSAVLAERQQQNAELANRMIQREAVQQDLLARITAFFSRAFRGS
jgi:small-conductance mechanosensitive channel/CRP-like cAMP-binding protein